MSEELVFEIKNRSGAFLDELARGAAEEARATGKEAKALAKALAPVSAVVRTRDRSGVGAKHLRDTITSEVKANGYAVTMRMGAEKFTAHLVEFGTTAPGAGRLAKNRKRNLVRGMANRAAGHAALVAEFGGERTPPRPFINPAMRVALKRFDERLVARARAIRLGGEQ